MPHGYFEFAASLCLVRYVERAVRSCERVILARAERDDSAVYPTSKNAVARNVKNGFAVARRELALKSQISVRTGNVSVPDFRHR